MRKHELVDYLSLRTGRAKDILNRYKVPELEAMLKAPFQLSHEQAKAILTSLQKTGGASFRPLTGELNPSHGYMVAVTGFEKQHPRVWNTEDVRLVVSRWLHDISYTGDSRYFIGLWEHNDTLYLDLAQHYTDLEVAVITGQQRKQLAIYDCKNKCEIKTR